MPDPPSEHDHPPARRLGHGHRGEGGRKCLLGIPRQRAHGPERLAKPMPPNKSPPAPTPHIPPLPQPPDSQTTGGRPPGCRRGSRAVPIARRSLRNGDSHQLTQHPAALVKLFTNRACEPRAAKHISREFHRPRKARFKQCVPPSMSDSAGHRRTKASQGPCRRKGHGQRPDRRRLAPVSQRHPDDRSLPPGRHHRPALLLPPEAHLAGKLPHVPRPDGHAAPPRARPGAAAATKTATSRSAGCRAR